MKQVGARICRNGCIYEDILRPAATAGPLRLCLATALLVPWLADAAGLSVSAGVLSDKVVYGNSQSAGRAVAVLDTSYRSADGWAFGSGLASLGGGAGRADAEVTLSAGRGGALSDNGAWQATYTRYQTLGSAAVRRPGYDQLSLAYGWAERLQLQALVSIGITGPAAGGGRTRGNATIVDATWHQPLGRRFGLDIALGHVSYSGVAVADYAFGSLGLSWGLGPVQVFASRISSGSRLPSAAGARAVVSVLYSF
jgi:hypothetical protein